MLRVWLVSTFVMLMTACVTTPQVISPTTVSQVTQLAPTITSTSTPTWTFTLSPMPTPSSTPTPIPTPTQTPTTTPTPLPAFTFKVLSYNILYGGGVERQFDSALPIAMVGQNRLPDILSFIKSANPDVLGIEEANGWDNGTPPIIHQVAQELGMNYYFTRTAGGFHLGFLTKLKILQTENLGPDVGRQGVIHATLASADGQPLQVFQVHLDPNSSDARLCEVNTLIQRMKPFTSQRTILIGDMNFQPLTQEYLSLEQAGWKPVAVATSWGLGSIDQIWIYPSVNWTTTSWYHDLALPSGLSDHNPVGAEIKIYPQQIMAPTPIPVSPTPSLTASPILSTTLTSSQIVRFEGFEDSCAFSKWASPWTTEKVTNGALEIVGDESWQATASRFNVFSEGQAVMTRFQATKDSEFEIYFDTSIVGTELYKRLGLHVQDNRIQATVWQGPSNRRIEKLSEEMGLVPTTWYSLLIAIGKQGEMLVQVWNPARTTRISKYYLPTNANWAGQPWVFRVGANKGKVLIDDFTELSFDKIMH